MADRKQPTPPPPGAPKPDPPPPPPRRLSEAMDGATAAYKRNLRGQVDRACFRRIAGLSNDILAKLPKNAALGEVTAALMLAATAYAEAAGNAHRLTELPRNEE